MITDYKTIIIIGPIGVGKTTQAKLLSEHLGLPRCSYDEVKGSYWNNQGLDKETASAIEEKRGIYAMLRNVHEIT